MKIQSIRLHPFAGVQEKTVELDRGLNILLGPNEAGKSTLFKALFHGLFSPAVLTSQQLEKKMGDFFPVTGGDIIRVDIELEIDDGKQVRIEKTWKRGNKKGRASLMLSDGTEISDETDVQGRIEGLLPVSPATMKTVLLSPQSGLQETIDNVRKDTKVRQELGTVLRKGVMETGGVSVDRFRSLLESEYESYFKRWNREQQYPENNRGILNPYKRDYGKLVGVFYTMERARLNYQETVEFENVYDEINQRISRLSDKLREIEMSYRELNPLKKAVQQRRSKENEFKLIEHEIEAYREVNKKWPVMEERLKTLGPELEEADRKIKALELEIERAEKKKAEAALRERLGKLESLKEKLDKAEKEEKETPKVSPQRISELRELQVRLGRLSAHIEAAKLSVSLEGKGSAGILWKEAAEDTSEKITLEEGKSEKRSASGGFSLETDDLVVRVFSGEGDIEELIEEREEKQRSFDGILREMKAASPEEAESMAELYREKTTQRKQAEQRYREELGEEDLQSLQAQLREVEAKSGEGETRSVSRVYEEKVGQEWSKKEVLREKERVEQQIARWTEKYGSHEEVIEKLGDLQYTRRRLQAEIDELP
ncbi:MAG: AAA family ATPase, partial [Spirochaetia bacterium]